MTAIKKKQHARLINASELAETLGISLRHLWRMKAAKELPKPVQLRNSVRWLLSDIEAWLEMGCPSQKRFEGRKATRAKASRTR